MLVIDRGQSLYASDIIKALHDIDMIVVEGTVYPLLNRLKRDEVLDYTWEESASGPPRKYYHLTPAGKDLLKHLTAQWKSLSSSIRSLLTYHA
jgi:PadR family transcriptional regulator PadR